MERAWAASARRSDALRATVGTGHGVAAPVRSTPDAATAIEVEALSKRYGDLAAVDGIDFTVGQGEVFAFLGPNGAGKSTTIKMLCTLAHPTSGRAMVAGFDVATQAKSVRRHIGLVFQEQTLDDQLTAEENLRFHAVLYGVPHRQIDARITRVLDLVALSDRRKDLVSTYSGGMARRLEIARGMLHTPKILFLDEPTVGLDPQTRALIWDDIQRLRTEEGVTIFLTTHYMDEAEYAERIAIIDHGSIIALDTPDVLKASVGTDTVAIETSDDDTALDALRSAGYRVERGERGLVAFVADEESAVGPIVAAAGVPVQTVRAHRPTLDDVFLHFTGREIREQHGESVPMFARAHGAHRS
jgi:ABC-2 type transport system ATP-binding protein